VHIDGQYVHAGFRVFHAKGRISSFYDGIRLFISNVVLVVSKVVVFFSNVALDGRKVSVFFSVVALSNSNVAVFFSNVFGIDTSIKGNFQS